KFESPSRISAALPGGLLPGHAIIYVIDAQGRESNAQEIYLSSLSIAGVSAASYNGSALAPEAIAAIFGSGLGTATQAAASVPLPVSLAGTSVNIKDSAGVEQLATLFYISPAQINCQIPPGTAAGAATVTVTSGNGNIATGTIQIAV